MPFDLSNEKARFTKTERAFLDRMAVIPGAFVPMEEFVDVLIRRDSKSQDPEPMVKVILSRLRRKLTNFTIQNAHGVGWRLVPKVLPTTGPDSHVDPSEIR